jgi:phenylacetic acid degradation operon negative regulatory protein
MSIPSTAAAPAHEATPAILTTVRPRVADGPRPRHILMTLLADYWIRAGSRAPSGALVELLGDFGISEAGARTVLSRVARDGRITVDREGRRTFYALVPRLRERLIGGLELIASFGLEAHEVETWSCVAFSVPEDQRAARHKLRAGLQWLGFAPLYDGLWVSPRRVLQRAETLVESLGITAASVFEADIRGIGSAYGRPTDAWDLASISAIYRDFIAELEPLAERMRSGHVEDREALAWRTEIMSVWRAIPTVDPGLPESLLPEDWPRARARHLFEELYVGLAAAAERRVHRAVARHDESLVAAAAAHGLSID